MKRNMIALGVGLATLATAAFAKPQYMGTVKSTYKLTGAAASAVKCVTCHVGVTKALNPFGKAIAAAQAQLKVKDLTPAVLQKVAGLDSDKDGKTNGAELKAGTNPGDSASK